MRFSTTVSVSNEPRSRFWLMQGIGLLFFTILGSLALIFFRERMMSYDSANYALEIEQYRHYCLPHGRWSSVFSQFLPLMALNLGCSLVFFLKLYSLSFVLIYYILYLLCTILFRNYRAGIMLMLTVSLGFSWMFFYGISELFMGMAFSVLLYAVAAALKENDSPGRKMILAATAFFLVYTISYFHQLALFPALFVLLFDGLVQRRWKDKWAWGILLFTVLWAYIRIRFFSVDDYTRGKILSFETYRSQLPHLFQLESWNYFVHYFTQSVKWLFYLFIVCTCWLVIRRNWLMLLLLLGYSFGYVMLVVLTYYKGESGLMIETYLPPLGLFAGFVLVELMWHEKRIRPLLLVTAWLLFVSLRGMYLQGCDETLRTDYLRRLTNYGRSLQQKKFLLSHSNLPVDLLHVEWALPLETVLYSSLPGKDSTVSFAWANRNGQYDSLMTRPGVFIGFPWGINVPFRNDALVSLPDGPYLKVNSSQRDSSFHPEKFSASNVSVRPLVSTVDVPYHEFAYVNVMISNSSGQKIHSVPDAAEPVMMSYRIYDLKGNLVSHQPAFTPLDVDVINRYEQAVRINSPSDAGDYFLEIDLVSGHDHFWKCSSRMKLHVPGRSIFRWL